MSASSTDILNTGINAVIDLFTDLLTYAVTNWIPVILAIVIVVSVIGFLYAKGKGLFGHGGK